MTDPHSKQALLKGLHARLALDNGLGVDFMPLPEGFWHAVSRADNPDNAEPPQRQQQQPPPAPRRPEARPAPSPRAAPPAPERRFPAVASSLVPYVEPTPCPEKEALLAPLRAEAEQCAACELCRKRSRMAWGEGSLNAKVMFIGEGPGRDEDREGRPFVGRSGRLLTDIIEKGMKLPRNEVYIANVVKCRPPGNRDPLPEEVQACSRYLSRQIEVIAPQILVGVGRVAGSALLGRPMRMSDALGKWYEFMGLPLRMIYHPSFLLRQRSSEGDRTEADRVTWRDVQEIMARLQQ